MLVEVAEYGYVSRGQNRYSVPILPDAGIPTVVAGNRCPVECQKAGAQAKEFGGFCSKHKLLCIGGLIAALILLTK